MKQKHNSARLLSLSNSQSRALLMSGLFPVQIGNSDVKISGIPFNLCTVVTFIFSNLNNPDLRSVHSIGLPVDEGRWP